MADVEGILRKVLEKVAVDENLKESEIIIKPITSGGANYTSAIFKTEIKSSNQVPLKLFAKVAQIAESLRPQLKADHLFEVERIVYNDLCQVYEKLQNQNGIPDDERFKFPKLYGCNPSYMEETVVLEDLTEQGYTLFDRFQSVNWEYASKVIEQLAKLHALSFAFKNVYPEEYKKVYDKIISKKDEDNDETMWKKIQQTALNATPEKYRERFLKYTNENKFNKIFDKYYGPGEHPVIVHGDFRNSNIMFKRKGGKVTSVIPVDYQTMRISNPVLDVIYFIYTGTSGDLRRLHMKQLLQHYYDTLSSFLLKLNLNPEECYTMDDFYNDYNDMLLYGLEVAIYILPIVLVDAENAPDTSKAGMDIANFAVKSSTHFDKRFNEILLEYVKIGLV